ncbi:MAG: recombinase family protein [Actinomycetota bacterium]
MTASPKTLKALLYSRVSTGRQAKSGLGLDDQTQAMTEAATNRGWTVVDHITDAGVSGKSVKARPGLLKALNRLDDGEADVLVVAKLDRLSRSVGDFAQLLDRAQRKGYGVVVLDVDVDTTKAAGEFVVNVLASAAQFERRLIGDRVKAAHAQRRLRGQRAGQRPELPNALRQRIAREVAKGTSLNAMASRLNEAGVATARGGKWYASTIRHVVRSVTLDQELARLSKSKQ